MLCWRNCISAYLLQVAFKCFFFRPSFDLFLDDSILPSLSPLTVDYWNKITAYCHHHAEAIPSCWRDNQVKMWGRPSLIHYYFGGTCSPWSLLYFGTENRDIDTISSGSIYILSLNSKSFAPVIYLSAESEGPKSNCPGESKLFFFATGNRQNFFWQQVSIIFFFIKLGFSSHWTYLYRNKHWTLVHLRAFVSGCLCRSAHAEKKPLKGFQFLWALLVTPTHTHDCHRYVLSDRYYVLFRSLPVQTVQFLNKKKNDVTACAYALFITIHFY